MTPPTTQPDAKELAADLFADFQRIVGESKIPRTQEAFESFAMDKIYTYGLAMRKHGLEEALGLVEGYPVAWAQGHRVIELQSEVVDETCLHLENAIKLQISFIK